MNEENKIKFKSIIENYKNIAKIDGIGTLSEKTLHKVVKNYLEPNQKYQEIKIGSYYADIFKDNKIIEIQTRQFNTLRSKLDFFFKNYEVTVCYPTFHKKTINWINPDTLLKEDIRKSPKKGSIYDVFSELYKIKFLLNNQRLKIKILLIDLEEYRLLNGWSKNKKKWSYRYDQVPVELVNEVDILDIKDYQKFIPDSLNIQFTSKDYSKATKLTLRKAQTALNVLKYLEIIEIVGKDSKLNVYELKH